MQLIKFETVTKVYNQDNYTASDCNSILFINTGVVNVIVDQVRLTPGQQLSIPGNVGELNVKQYAFNFVGAVIGRSLTVVRKVYGDARLQEAIYKKS